MPYLSPPDQARYAAEQALAYERLWAHACRTNRPPYETRQLRRIATQWHTAADAWAAYAETWADDTD